MSARKKREPNSPVGESDSRVFVFRQWLFLENVRVSQYWFKLRKMECQSKVDSRRGFGGECRVSYPFAIGWLRFRQTSRRNYEETRRESAAANADGVSAWKLRPTAAFRIRPVLVEREKRHSPQRHPR